MVILVPFHCGADGKLHGSFRILGGNWKGYDTCKGYMATVTF